MGIKKYRDKVIIKKRMLIIFSILFLLFFLLECRAFYIMMAQSERYKRIAKDQWTNSVKIDAKRGRILDRNGNELANSFSVYRVDLDMNTLRQTLQLKGITNEDLAPKLAEALAMEQQDVLKVLNKTLPSGLPLASATLKRRIEQEDANKVREVSKQLGIKGILVSPDTTRYYKNGNFLAHVLGHTNSDGVGLTGIEKQYDKVLAGTPGVLLAESDRDRKELPYNISQYTKPVDGKDLVLTIDETIQSICEKAANQALIDNKAKAVTIIATDPKTGEILALVNKPDYNPNNPWEEGKNSDELNKLWRNRAVNDTFEPGSIFKVVTALAALSEGTSKESDKFVCSGGTTVLKSHINCWKTSGHGTQNFIEILKNSCNVGFIEVGKALGADKLNRYISMVGFGQKTGIDLPGEAKGIVKKTKDITAVDLATMSFGHVNTVSCVQYITAFNAVANGGYLITPHLMKETGYFDENGKLTNKEEYKIEKKEILNSNITATLRGYLEKVCAEGGSKNAFIEGYHIAGKTGTAKKPGTNTKGYAEGKYISSFAGMAPANDPRITLMVSIDEPDPSNYYAGQIAAPVAKIVFNDIFNYLALKADATGEEVARSLRKEVIIPNLRGMKKEEAVKILKANHIDYTFEGDGEYVSDSLPIPGITVKEGDKITLYRSSTPTYNNKVVAVPNLRGYSRERVIELLNSLGIKAVFSGDGLASEQSYEPNSEVQRGTVVTVNLEEIGD